LQLLSELVPGISRIAVVVRAPSQASARYVEEAETAARRLGAQLQVLTLREPAELDAMFRAARGASAVVMTDDAVFTAHRARIAELALETRLPVIYTTREFVNAGGLMSYGPNTTDLYRRAAAYVDKILRGARPADLPIQQPIKFELIVNLVAARALGLDVPSTLLARADEVIE
jgi:putative ABC transport system substrate-binding protein